MSLLEIQNLDISIATTQVCNKLNLTIEPGQVWAILGRNGIGKTTLLHTLAGLREADNGEIFIHQDNIKQLNRKQVAQKIGLLLQHHEDAFPTSILETVLIGRHPYIPNWQWESAMDKQLAMNALEQVELQHMAHRQTNQLSGGERQRVAIATLLTQNPEILLLDEPNSHLDLNYQVKLLDHICQYARENNQAVIMSLHDINLAARFADHLIFLHGEGEYLSGSSDKLLNTKSLSELFQHPIQQVQNGNNCIYIPQ